MNVREYLQRIGMDRTEKPSLSLLQELQHHHLLAVPFENLDIFRGKAIVLEEKQIYDKVVHQQRGGFCYELNGIFAWLLRKLGFAVLIGSGRVYEASNARFGPEFDHLILLVHLDVIYLVDVGFGDSFRKPIAMPDGTVVDVSGTYRIHSDRRKPGEYCLQKQEKKGWRPEYSFTLYPRNMSDFKEMCVYHQTSPESHFTKGPFCTVATEQGRLTLSANSLTVTEGATKKKISVASPEVCRHMLLEHFGIDLKGDMTLPTAPGPR